MEETFLQLYRNDTALLKVRPLLSLKAIDCRICCLLSLVYLCLHVLLLHEGQPMMWMHFIDWNVEELLSKQMHYDWGLRAVKSLLRQAQSCTMPNPHSPIASDTSQVRFPQVPSWGFTYFTSYIGSKNRCKTKNNNAFHVFRSTSGRISEEQRAGDGREYRALPRPARFQSAKDHHPGVKR